MKNLFIYTLLLMAIGLGFSTCDSTTAPGNVLSEEPAITNLKITPQNVEFSPDIDGIKDTTVQVHFSVTTKNINEGLHPEIIITDRHSDEEILQQVLEPYGDKNVFTSQIPFETKTTFFKEYSVNVFFTENNNDGSYARASINLTGFSVVPPEILSVENPEQLQRPNEGEEAVPFLAKVTDEEGLDTIEGVYLRLISQESGEVSGSPFQLYDDGDTGGDVIPNDSVFTTVFRFNSNNQLQTYDIHYYAVDKGGLVSDTAKTTFSIVE